MKKVPIENESDIVLVRQAVRALARDLGFSLVETTKVVTATSELARNAYDHAGGGEAEIESIDQGARLGLKVVVSDQGPGISDVDEAMLDGFSTGSGFGHGLGGARRLANEFSIDTTPGSGTRVTIIRWK